MNIQVCRCVVGYIPKFRRIVVLTVPGSSSPRIALPRSKVITIIRNVEKYLKPNLTCHKNLKSRGFILLTVHTSVWEDVMLLKVIYLFYKSVESVVRDVIHRFLKAIFLLVLPLHTGNKVILRSQIVTVEFPHWKRLMM